MNIERIDKWCDAAERGLEGTYYHDHDLIVAGVNAGALQLWRINRGRSWAVTRIEGEELQVCCYRGTDGRDFMRHLMSVAAQQNLIAVWFFTEQRAVGRLVRPLGFAPEATLFRAPVSALQLAS